MKPVSIGGAGSTRRICAASAPLRESMIDETIGEFGRVDVLVNNAWGGGSMVRLEHSTDAQMDHGLHMAFWAAYWSMLRRYPGDA